MRFAIAALASLLLLAAPARAADDLFGVVTQGDLTQRDYDRMQAGGVATLRFGFWWYALEPRPGVFDWSYADAIMAGAASAGVEPQPFVYGTPSWLARDSARAPVGSARARHAWQAFLRAAAHRYGAGGSFWSGRARRAPIREWQVWNEPSFPLYWHPRPSAPEYARLVSMADRAIHAGDPRARIALAGLAPVRGGVEPWRYLEDLYSVRGAARHFDVVALHPYSPNVFGIKYQLRLMREVMAAGGDGRKPIAITELGWASAGPRHHALVRTPAGQAAILERSFSYLSRTRERWRLSGVSWYSWRDSRTVESLCDFCRHSGLFTLRGKPKPAWAQFRRQASP